MLNQISDTNLFHGLPRRTKSAKGFIRGLHVANVITASKKQRINSFPAIFFFLLKRKIKEQVITHSMAHPPKISRKTLLLLALSSRRETKNY